MNESLNKKNIFFWIFYEVLYSIAFIELYSPG